MKKREKAVKGFLAIGTASGAKKPDSVDIKLSRDFTRANIEVQIQSANLVKAQARKTNAEAAMLEKQLKGVSTK